MKAKAEIKNIAKFCFVLGIIFNASAGQATSAPTIDRADIIPSTTLPTLTLSGHRPFAINQINDGIKANVNTKDFPFNGFASPASQGTITFDFAKEFDLSSFILWNDVNVQNEGIKNFHLDFFDKSNNLISSYFPKSAAPLGQIAPKEYAFDKVPAVSRANLVVSDSYWRIEIREAAFTGTPSAKSVPEPTSALALGAFVGFGILVNKKKRTQLS
jgi:hypothetical protein